jgi:cytochrome c biogenesis protein CcmG, thiol:disulfide interchange protein DsbE
MLHSFREALFPNGRPSIRGFIVTALVPAILLTVLVARILHANSVVTRAPAVSANPNAAPDFTIQVWNGAPGEKIHMAALKGKPVVVNFWGSWCIPCAAEAPLLSAAAKTYAAQGVVFLGVAWQTKVADGKAFIQQHEITYPCGPDDSGDILTNFGITGLPQTVLIDRSGVVVRHFPGQITADTFGPAVEALAKGEPQPAATPSPAPSPTAAPATPTPKR